MKFFLRAMEHAFQRTWALFLVLLISGMAQAESLVIGTYDLESGRVQLIRAADNSYTLKLTDASNGKASISLQSEELTGLANHLVDAGTEVQKLPVAAEPFEFWGIEVGDTSLWLWGAHLPGQEPILALVLKKEAGETVKTGGFPTSFKKLEQYLLAIPSREMEIQRPNKVTIKGNYVQHAWNDGRLVISNLDAKTFLGLKDIEEPRVDLIAAAERSGYLLFQEGEDLNVRRLTAAYVPILPESVATDYVNPNYSGYSSGYSSSGSYNAGNSGPVSVRSYTRKDGTRVKAHTRSRPRRR